MASSNDKIIELPDDTPTLMDGAPEASDDDDDELPLQFKQTVLKNKSYFQKQLLESSMLLDPTEIFEFKTKQEVEGETEKDLYSKMETQVLNIQNIEDDSENPLIKLANAMTPIAEVNGIYKKINEPGEGTSLPLEGSYVTVHYDAYVQDEVSNDIKLYDSTILRNKPETFMRGNGKVMDFLDICVGTMKLKERAEFVIAPHMAYGEMGCPPRIPPNAYLYFKITMIEWVDSSAAEAFARLPVSERKQLPFLQVLEASKSEKQRATFFYEREQYGLAAKSYTRALGWILDHGYADEEEEKVGENLCLKLHLDLALVYLKMNKPRKTCIQCKEALLINPRSAKAHYRFGLAKQSLGDLSSARNSLLKARDICPDDPSIARALIAINDRIKKENYIEKDLCRRMMGISSAPVVEKAIEPTLESHKTIRRQLEHFVENADANQYVFPPCMAESERKFLESEVTRLNLKLSVKTSLTGDPLCTVIKQ